MTKDFVAETDLGVNYRFDIAQKKRFCAAQFVCKCAIIGKSMYIRGRF